jgi:hypothetical protein
MPYRATCPACGIRLPRSGYFHPFHQCPACHTLIRPEPTWNRTGNLICGGLLGLIVIGGAFLGATLGARGWLLALAAFVAFLTLCWALWPYMTPYEAVLHTHGFPVHPNTPAPTLPPSLSQPPPLPWSTPLPPPPPVLVPPTPHYRLKTILGLALTILGALFWAHRFSQLAHHPPRKSATPTLAPLPATQPAQ